MWFLHWWPFAISHHINPFYSYYIWYPHGQNLAWLTSVPFEALLGLPVTLTAGPVAAFNMLTVIEPALAAWTCFLLARKMTDDWTASLAAGYLFGFSAYELGQLALHLNLDMIFLVPLALLLCLKRLRMEITSVQFVGLFAIILLCQLGSSTEILASLLVFGSFAWAIFLVCTPEEGRPIFLALAREAIFAIAVMMLLAAPFFYYIVTGLGDLLPDELPLNLHSIDPINYFLPLIKTGRGHMAYGLIGHWRVGGGQISAYLGLPLGVVLIFYFATGLRRAYVRGLLIMLSVVMIASLGPVLHWHGGETKIRLPWMLASRLPLISSALPERFSMYVSLIAALVAALWLGGRSPNGIRIAKYALVLLAVYFMAPPTRAANWTAYPRQPFFTASNTRQVLGGIIPNVLILPFSYEGPGMSWQLQSNMAFTQTGGYGGVPPRAEMDSPLIAKIHPDFASLKFANDFSALCDTHQVQFLLIGPGTSAAVRNDIMALGWAEALNNGVIVVHVPPPDQFHYTSIAGDYWPDDHGGGWMGRQVRLAERGKSSVLTLIGGPMRARIAINGTTGIRSVDLGPGERQNIVLPEVTDITLSARNVFVPNRLYHNGDRRRLSVRLIWQTD